jgi:hypothetical protein
MPFVIPAKAGIQSLTGIPNNYFRSRSFLKYRSNHAVKTTNTAVVRKVMTTKKIPIPRRYG